MLSKKKGTRKITNGQLCGHFVSLPRFARSYNMRVSGSGLGSAYAQIAPFGRNFGYPLDVIRTWQTPHQNISPAEFPIPGLRPRSLSVNQLASHSFPCVHSFSTLHRFPASVVSFRLIVVLLR